MVGIGGGAPSPSADIRLGDVVVSKPTHGYAGVIQYDYGKAIAGDDFITTGVLDKPPAVLLTAIARLQARHHLHGNNIDVLYHQALDKYGQLSEAFSCPGPENDLLFVTDYKHQTGRNTCDDCTRSRLKTRLARHRTQPRIFYGLIASANQVLRDSLKREALSRKHGILCFEMEAAGLMDVVPCLVIRGICDYCDSHKSKQWQGYAAVTAAAYVKELLSVIPFSDVTLTPAVDQPDHDVHRGEYKQRASRRQVSDEAIPSRQLSGVALSASTWASTGHSVPPPRLSSASDRGDSDTLVIAIDLGTRYTKVAFTTEHDIHPARMFFITQ
ncbi:nucleoside phosphorylase domain-containing protein [Aspergillus cavernicola]|uniref:Nucleoside phosphorylase domain-containing protein n=1 Tax=Aspergillus cavernicola TaxID=176166 RepID=A0ABR4HPI2_9EURO